MSADGLAHGIQLFNNAEFFAAHEALEDVWREAPAEEKKFFQGLTQVAVAFHHHSTGNHIGMKSVLRRAVGNLEKYPANSHGINLPALLAALRAWCDAMDTASHAHPLPRIELLGELH
jgi:predicted metal-dependent hydrolase